MTKKEEKKSEYTVKDLLKDLEGLDENVCIAVIGKHCEREYVENMFLEKDLKSGKDTLIIFTDNSDEKEFEENRKLKKECEENDYLVEDNARWMKQCEEKTMEIKKLKSDLAYERTMLDNVRAEYDSLQDVIKKLKAELDKYKKQYEHSMGFSDFGGYDEDAIK